MSIEGKHALVTGGGTGIGLAIARALADEGAQVTITGRRQEVLDKVAGGGLHGIAMDVTDEAQVRDVIDTAVDARGPLQIIVANAGIAEGRKLHKTDTELWRRIMATNLDGVFWTVREGMRSMLGTGWGRVLAVSSIAGVRGLPGGGAYSASKHGVVGMMRSLAEDFLGEPYTFNSICPGYVDTDIITRNVDAIRDRAGISADAAKQIMVESNRHNRLIAPEEVAAAALWLCRPGSESVNGQEIMIAGGQVVGR
ncbi:NAD(P)-dependent dehydrogenase, short-chain alcohol dehydrogenase family [Lutimaribacter pacificus]|uniref:NAD(P)-dependent dehydrogenase, short-chain alcohol dehydrogenase family n=1 Tax=Lutimaribacter pacificus TaxID=391948 RepID=A0A1H0B4K7_9RHOB|nr:SDR family oxidoreductase [Lutimaribacter pacificus]SDN40628.1 NAD(P)-dependent dehydrogenase, short-chain alcohol dehydrogenase family [Lutimaribacter pacificus]SHJ60493.1 NAD(P)-dependent dehydrogenase, short-chain alcohol dehydrogenase family [Lutimaribacter pacificus]